MDRCGSCESERPGVRRDLARSIRHDRRRDEVRASSHGSADREDVDPSSTSIAFEPCRVEDVLPAELSRQHMTSPRRLMGVCSPISTDNYTPYEMRNLNAFVSLGRFEDAFRLLSDALACRRPRGWRRRPRSSGAARGRRSTLATCPTPGSERSSPPRFGGCCCGKTAAPSNCSERSLTPGGRVRASRCIDCRPPWRRQSQGATRSIPSDDRTGLVGTSPEQITFRYPGPSRLMQTAIACDIRHDVISAPNLSRLEIDF